MIGSELDAAGVRDPLLRESYRRCRALNAKYGRTFFLATRLLAPQRRPAVHAFYGFARRADDILDDFDFTLTAAERGARLQQLAAALFDQMVDGAEGGDESLAAVVHTARRYGIAWQLFDDFLASMRMDLTVSDYPDRAALERYMYGSAEVIGLQLLPVLGTGAGAKKPRRTRRHLEKHSSSPTFCAMSTRTWPATGSTCPPTNSPRTAWIATC